jgi:hypothetical protein
MRIRTKADLADWIRRQLGEPVVDVILDVSQMDDCIDESIDYFTEHAGGHGNEEQYMAIIQTQRIMEVSSMPTTAEMITGSAHGVVQINYKAEYQLPRNVVAITNTPLDMGNMTPTIQGNWVTAGGGYAPNDPMLNFAFAAAETFNSPTLAGVGSSAMAAGLFFPGTAYSDFSGFNSYGSRGGSRSGGGGVDLVTYELSLQYMEMMKQRYTVKTTAQFLEAQRKVRFSPRPNCAGMILLPVIARVDDPDLYDQIWIRRYAVALCKRVIGMNTKKYEGMVFPGGGSINGEFYYNEGKEEIEKLEQEIADNHYGEPPQSIFVG